MLSKNTNTCTRCGKERVESRKYSEDVTTFFGTSTIIYTDTVCPDGSCQKIVEERLASQRAKTEQLKEEKQKRLDTATAARKARSLENLKN